MYEIDIAYALFIGAALGLCSILFFLGAYKFLQRSRAYAVAVALAAVIAMVQLILVRPTNLEMLTFIEKDFWRRAFYPLWVIGFALVPVTIYAVINFLVRLVLPKKYFQPKPKKEKGEQFKLAGIKDTP